MPSPVVPLYRVLVDEYESQGIQPPLPKEELEERRQRLEQELAQPGMDPQKLACQVDAAMVKELYAWLHAKGVKRTALCFSGGGIRSATFGLGLLQGLARHGLLGQFDFLSSVSGGGYLASWLTGWIQRERLRLQDPKAAITEVESCLRSLPDQPLDPEPPPVRYLRSYSRYMSPRLGLLSADTWSLVAIFTRNLLLNWLVLLPLIAAVLMIPRISTLLLRLGHRPWFQANQSWLLPTTLWTAIALGSLALAYMGANRPSLQQHSRFPKRLHSQEWFLVLCLLPLVLMGVLASLYWAWLRMPGTPLDKLQFDVLGWTVSPGMAFALFGAFVHLGGFLVCRIWVRKYIPGELLVVVLTGALGGALVWIPVRLFFQTVNTGLTAELYVCFAVPLLLLSFVLAAILFVGLSSYYTTDADREWLARAAAWVLIAIVARSAFSGIVIFGPVAFLAGVAYASSLGGVSGVLTLVLGRSSRSKPKQGTKANSQEKKTSGIMDLVLSFAAPLFALFVFVVLSLATTLLIRWVTTTFSPSSHHFTKLLRHGLDFDDSRLLNVVYYSPWWAVLAVLAALLLLGGLMGAFVDINRFSLHAGYRDRLIRAYLGASRPQDRRPNPFTGFDGEDNILMKDLRGNRPLHIVNMTLNLVAGKDLAWQDRKAETFTASALHAGSFRLGYRDVAEYGLHRDGKTALSLGTAMAISGAAASPNMGYNSSPVVTFLLALFNVRLGWWLGNPGPAGDKTYNTPGPRFAPRPFFAEAFGLTDSQHPYVYLSDGGHFENFGLYEMILRRCQFIVVADAGGDPEYEFGDLGNAVAKVRIDLGVPIQFEKILMLPRGKDYKSYDVSGKKDSRPYCAIGRICYSCVDDKAEDGYLLYVKPCLNGSEPVDVYNYARMHPAFPQESTADQFFTESQFESYRALGSHAMETILEGLPAGATLKALFDKVENELGKPPACG